MSEILFGQSYYLRFDPKLWAAMRPYPPLGTLYAAAYLRSRGYAVALFDAMLAASEAEWAQALDRERPSIAVLYEDNFNYLSKMCLLRMRAAAFTMIAAGRAHGCTVIVAGADATDHPELYLARGADYALSGEGEATLGELIDHLSGRNAAPLAAIRGLAYLAADGALVRTSPRPDLANLDALPLPAWDLVDVGRYQGIWRRRHGYFSLNVATTRGCPFHCNWCAKPIWGQRYHSRGPEHVVAELRWLKDAYHPDHISFVDDIFGIQPGWIARFADLVEQQDVRLPFKSLQRVDLLLRGDTIPALRRAGAQTVWVGAESGSQRILDAMEKGTRVEQIREAAVRLHAADIGVGFFLQFGYPGETRADIERTLQLVRDCRPDDLGMSVAYPLPGTPFHAQVRAQLGAKRNWSDSDDLAMLYRGPFPSAFYRQLHVALHLEFRARKGWATLGPALRHPWRLRPAHARQAAALLWRLARLPLARWRLEQLAKAPAEQGEASSAAASAA